MFRAKSRALPALAMVLVVGLPGLSACGGSEESKADYIVKVDAICEKHRTEVANLKAPANQNDNAALAGYYDQLAVALESLVKDFDDAGRPKDGKQQIDDILKRERTQIDQIRQLSAALRANDQPKARQISGAAEPESQRIQSDLKAFGFTKCGS